MTSSRLLIVQHHQDGSDAWLLGMVEVQMLVLFNSMQSSLSLPLLQSDGYT